MMLSTLDSEPPNCRYSSASGPSASSYGTYGMCANYPLPCFGAAIRKTEVPKHAVVVGVGQWPLRSATMGKLTCLSADLRGRFTSVNQYRSA